MKNGPLRRGRLSVPDRVEMNHLTGYPFQFRPSNSPVHRLKAGWKLGLATAMSVAAIAAHPPLILGGLLLLNIVFWVAAGLKWHDLWRDTRWFLVQTFIVVCLYAFRYGFPGGLWPGLRVGIQIFLFFLPGAILLRTTTGSRMTGSLRRVMPARMAFVISTSLRYIPVFAKELREIVMIQRLRGARITPHQLLNPHHWKDVLNCVFIPLMVRALKTADNASLSAEARGFGKEKGTGEARSVHRWNRVKNKEENI